MHSICGNKTKQVVTSFFIIPSSLSWVYPQLFDPPFGSYFDERDCLFLIYFDSKDKIIISQFCQIGNDCY